MGYSSLNFNAGIRPGSAKAKAEAEADGPLIG
jgi:hypothetical protein